jgi:hypothetical protein
MTSIVTPLPPRCTLQQLIDAYRNVELPKSIEQLWNENYFKKADDGTVDSKHARDVIRQFVIEMFERKLKGY